MPTPIIPHTDTAAIAVGLAPPARIAHVRIWQMLAAVAVIVVAAAAANRWLPTPPIGRSLVLHSILELIPIGLSGFIFAIGRAARHRNAPAALSAAALLFFCVALLDLGHLRLYPGMPPLVEPATMHASLIFWLAARLAAAIGVLIIVQPWLTLRLPRWAKAASVPAVLLGLGLLIWVGLWHPSVVPPLFRPESGPTGLKVVVELAVILLNGAAIFALATGRSHRRPFPVPMLLAATGLMVLSELCFLDYLTATDLEILIGHLVKIVAYFCLYQAIVEAAVREPYRLLQESETALRQSQKMEAVGRLAGGVAHEFNNLLTTILGSSELARHDVEPNSVLDEHLREITDATQRAAQLSRQLLAFGRPQISHRERLDSAQVLDAFVSITERVIADGIDVTVEHPTSPLFVESDRTQLDQMLLNLTLNARDAMPRGGALRLAVDAAVFTESEPCVGGALKPGRYVMFEVSDTGHGIPAAEVTRVFEPFFTTKAPGAGTGLGLSMVFGVASAHGGGVQLRSSVREGTVVQVYLPMAA